MKTASIRTLTLSFGLLVLTLIISSCASTIADRIEERPQAFNSLSKNQQRLVMQGRITQGMNRDVVYIALGSPLRILQERYDSSATETWVYGSAETYSTPGIIIGSGFYGGPYSYGNTTTVIVETFVVYFNSNTGLVRGWREL